MICTILADILNDSAANEAQLPPDHWAGDGILATTDASFREKNNNKCCCGEIMTASSGKAH